MLISFGEKSYSSSLKWEKSTIFIFVEDMNLERHISPKYERINCSFNVKILNIRSVQKFLSMWIDICTHALIWFYKQKRL